MGGLSSSYLIAHDPGGGDGPKLAKVGAKPLIVQGLVEVLDVEVASLGWVGGWVGG